MNTIYCCLAPGEASKSTLGKAVLPIESERIKEF